MARKTPKPKLAAYERIDPKADPQEVYPLLRQLVRDHRPDLQGAKIALAWRYGWKKNKDGQLVLGKCKKAADLDKQFHDQDFVIILNNEAWKTLSELQRRALMHHELEHAAVSEDQNGNPKKDARGRQMYRVRKHDLEEFREIVSRYGCYKSDIEQFVRAAMDSARPPGPSLFDGVATPEGEKAPTPEPSANGAVAGDSSSWADLLVGSTAPLAGIDDLPDVVIDALEKKGITRMDQLLALLRGVAQVEKGPPRIVIAGWLQTIPGIQKKPAADAAQAICAYLWSKTPAGTPAPKPSANGTPKKKAANRIKKKVS